MGNKSSTYFNILPKEVRLLIADKLGIDEFLHFNRYLSDAPDIDYMFILKQYDMFDDIKNTVEYYYELRGTNIWRDIYASMKINTGDNSVVKFEKIIKSHNDVAPTSFLRLIKDHYSVFRTDILNICLSHGYGLISWLKLGTSLGSLYTYSPKLFRCLLLDNLSSELQDYRWYTFDGLLLYYMIGRKNSKINWPSLDEDYLFCFDILFQLKGTDWIERIDESRLITLYKKLGNGDNKMGLYNIKGVFRVKAMKLIKHELSRRDNI